MAADGRILVSPAEHARLPKIRRDRTQYTHITRGELSTLLTTADDISPTAGALVSLMGVLGLRVSEACALDVDCADRHERGHRILTAHGKGATVTGIPVPVPVGRRIDTARGDRPSGPLLLRRVASRIRAAGGFVFPGQIDGHLSAHYLGILLADLPVDYHGCTPATEIHGLVVDSRHAAPGLAFLAVPGLTHDGHAFLPQAQAAGAAVLLLQRGRVPAPAHPHVWLDDTAAVLPQPSAQQHPYGTTAPSPQDAQH